MSFYLFLGLAAVASSFLVSFGLWKAGMKYHWHRDIRPRDVHKDPTPRLGGIAVFVGILVGVGVGTQIPQLAPVFESSRTIIAVVVAAFIVVALGVVDDIIELDWVTKLSGQVLAAGVVAWQGLQIVSLPIGGITLFSPTLSLVLTVLAIVLVMNAVNFIDGLDGLVVGVALISTGVFFLYAFVLSIGETGASSFDLATLLTVLLAGALLGFLPLNWHPAKMFLGDSGSLLVGLMMSVSAISVTGQIDPATVSPTQLLPAFLPVILPLAVLIVPLVDFSLAVWRRLRRGMSPFDADRAHLHHRLLDMGHTHRQAVLILYAWTAVLAIGTLMFLFVAWYLAALIIFVGLIGSAIVTLSPDNRVSDDPLAIDEEVSP
jgi:UDP-GlcNAc:undecaprenyl-phosphate/decaprenyl-phosphate GlcNAc-1-phosphate transferase